MASNCSQTMNAHNLKKKIDKWKNRYKGEGTKQVTIQGITKMMHV